MASAIDERRPILAGDLSEFSVQSLMAAFSLGRQVVTIEVLDARGVCDARIVMKGGRVLSASAAGHTGATAVQHLLASAVPARFRVVRETSDSFARAPHITTLAEVTGASGAVRRLPAPAPRALVGSRAEPRASVGSRTRVMEGSLSDFDVATILQVVSTARQHTVMEVLTPQGVRAGSIQLKAGKVLCAETGSLRGVAAVRQLLSAPNSFRFAVFRALGTSGALPLLGAVDEVLLQAASEEPAKPWPRAGLHLAPPPSPADLEPDPDEIETLIPPPGAPSAGLVAELEAAVDGAWDELEDEVTQVIEPRAPRSDAPTAATPNASGAPAVAASRPDDAVPVLEGRLTDFDLSSVIQVAGLSRQPTAVLIFDDQRQLIGDIRVHAGQLLSVQALGRRDQAALRFLLHTPRDFSFSVWRQPGPLDPTLSPLGSVSELLQLATSYALAGPTLTGTEDVPHFRAQAASLPATAPGAQAWRRALGVGLVLGLAVGAVATSRLVRESAPAQSSAIGASQPAVSVARPAVSAQPAVAEPHSACPGPSRSPATRERPRRARAVVRAAHSEPSASSRRVPLSARRGHAQPRGDRQHSGSTQAAQLPPRPDRRCDRFTDPHGDRHLPVHGRFADRR